MFERYTVEAAQAIRLVKEEAIASNASQVETEHLLVGRLKSDPVLCARVNLDISLIRVDGGGSSPQSFQPLSHESKRVLAYSAEEAERLGHPKITCWHIALGILREKDCKAAKLLRDQGIAPQIIKEGLIL